MFPDVIHALGGLAQKSLIVVDDGPSGVRYRYLETIREYARERLAESGEESEQKCLELGAVDYIKKPIQKEILLMRVERACRRPAVKE